MVSVAQRNSNKMRTEKGRLNLMVRSLVSGSCEVLEMGGVLTGR